MSDEDQERRSELDALGERIAKARGEEQKAQASRSSGAAAGDGLRIAIEFVVSVLMGLATRLGAFSALRSWAF